MAYLLATRHLGRSVSRNGQFSGQLWKQLETFVPLKWHHRRALAQSEGMSGKLKLSWLPTSVGKKSNRVCNHFSIFEKNSKCSKFAPPKKMSDSLNFPFPMALVRGLAQKTAPFLAVDLHPAGDSLITRVSTLSSTAIWKDSRKDWQEPYKKPHPTHGGLHFCYIRIVLYDYVMCI